jgi:PST family polysaccharide transporter
MFHFGKHMTVSTVVIWVIKNIDYVFVGKYFGKEALGFYTLAFKLSDLIATNVVRILGSVLFPAFAEIGHDIDRVRAAWLRAVKYSMLLIAPMGVVLMAFAPEIVAAFFEKGLGIVETPMAILTVFALCRGLGVPLGDLAKGIGKPKILTTVALLHAGVMVPLLLVVTSAIGTEWLEKLGLVWVSCGVSGTALFVAIGSSLYLTGREVRFTMRQVAIALSPSTVAGLAMAGAGIGSKWALHAMWPGIHPIAVLMPACLVALAAYAGVLFGLFPGVVKDLVGLARRQLAARKAKGAPKSGAEAPEAAGTAK